MTKTTLTALFAGLMFTIGPGAPADAAQPPARCKLLHETAPFYTVSAGHIVTFQQYVVERCRGKQVTTVARCEPLWWPLGVAPPSSWTYGVWDGGTWPESCRS